jgi:Lysyl oxidase
MKFRSFHWRCSLLFVALGSLVMTAAASAQERLPNLRALPPTDLLVTSNGVTGNPELRLTATSWNSGAGPLELIAGATGPAGQDVYQRVYTVSGSYTDYLAGTFVWHPAHNHFHFQEYALYTLNPVNAPGASKREAYKTSFCVEDTGKVDTRLSGAPKRPVYVTCNEFVQGMSVGWGDTYASYLAGQEIDLTGNPDGLYELTVAFDPSNRIRETNDNDNTACLLVQIGVAAKTVQTVGACGTTGGAVSITSISPNAAAPGSVVDAIITGTNFSPGVAVGFENGSGPSPVASNVTVLNNTTISLTVTVKQKGGGGDPVWDLRVGSAVLQNAFEVLK